MLLRLLKDLFGGTPTRPPVENRREVAREHLDRAFAAHSQGRLTDAFTELTRAADLTPEDLSVRFALAEVAYLSGDRLTALEYCERLRRVPEGLQATDMLMSLIRFQGEFYFDVLQRILAALEPRTYLETGVFRGESLRLVKAPTLAIGIDPEPELAGPLEANQRVFAETSDDFFAKHDVRAEFGGLPIDLGFIDGMHRFEYALRDFANIERHSTPQSTILIHDCYPLDRVTAERDRIRTFWSGDIWRLVVLLKKYRPELAINTIATAPTGLTVVRNLDPSSRLLMERHDELCREFLALDYSYIEDDMPGKLSLFPNDWGKVQALFA